jgi:hypothetical protein
MVGAGAELLGAIATVATLGYLAAQIRQSNKLAQLSAVTARVDQRTHQATIISQTPEINRIFWAGLNEPETLSGPEYQHFESIFAAYFNGQEAAFSLREENALTEEEWTSQVATFRWLASTPGFRRYWTNWAPVIRPDFKELVEGFLHEGETG